MLSLELPTSIVPPNPPVGMGVVLDAAAGGHKGRPLLVPELARPVLAPPAMSVPPETRQAEPAQVFGERVPSVQRAVITPEMGSQLNLCVSSAVPVREPGPGEVVVRMLCTGICCSDVCFSMGPEPGFPRHNHIAGHEGIGRVARAWDPALLGRAVAVRYLASSCGACTYCLRGLPTSCPGQRCAPKQVTGTLQQYATLPATCLLFLPEGVVAAATSSLSTAACSAALCSGSTALVALRAAQVQPGDVVVVVGVAGAIGHLAGAMAKQIMGARVVGVDLARKTAGLRAPTDYGDVFLGAPAEGDEDEDEDGNDDAVWDRFQASLLAACAQLRGGGGQQRLAGPGDLPRAAEAVVVASSKPGGFRRLDRYVCDGGHIVCVGVPRGGHAVSIPLTMLVERNLHVSGNLMGGRQDALQVMDWIRAGRIKPNITTMTLDDVPAHMHKLAQAEGTGKAVVLFE